MSLKTTDSCVFSLFKTLHHLIPASLFLIVHPQILDYLTFLLCTNHANPSEKNMLKTKPGQYLIRHFIAVPICVTEHSCVHRLLSTHHHSM